MWSDYRLDYHVPAGVAVAALNVLGIIQAALAGTGAAAAVVFWAGETNRLVNQNTKDIATVTQEQKTDHDSVTQLNQKVDDVQKTVNDISQDVKALRQRK